MGGGLIDLWVLLSVLLSEGDMIQFDQCRMDENTLSVVTDMILDHIQ